MIIGPISSEDLSDGYDSDVDFSRPPSPQPIFQKDAISSCADSPIQFPLASVWKWMNPINWIKAAGDGLSKTCHAIDYYGNYALDSGFREEVKAAKNEAMKIRHSYLIHSEQDVSEARQFMEAKSDRCYRLASPPQKEAIRDLLSGIAVCGGAAMLGPTPLGFINAGLSLSLFWKVIDDLKGYGIAMAPVRPAMERYGKMVEANRLASYDLCVADGYTLNLQFPPNPTKLGNSFIDVNAGPNGGLEINMGWGF